MVRKSKKDIEETIDEIEKLYPSQVKEFEKIKEVKALEKVKEKKEKKPKSNNQDELKEVLLKLVSILDKSKPEKERSLISSKEHPAFSEVKQIAQKPSKEMEVKEPAKPKPKSKISNKRCEKCSDC